MTDSAPTEKTRSQVAKTPEQVMRGGGPLADYMSIRWNRVPRLAEVGKIKIGGKGEERTSGSGTKYRLPKFTDHFILTTLERDRAGDFIPDKKLMDLVGQNCRELDMMLLYDDIELNFPTYYAYYKGRTAWCRGNGEKARRVDDSNKGKFLEVACTCPFIEPDEKGQARCGPHAVLSVILPQAQVLGGVFTFRTGSWFSIQNIRSSLMFIQTLTGGVLARVPLKLKLQMQTVQTKNGAKTVPICTVVYQGGEKGQGVEGLYKTALEIAKNRSQYAVQYQQMEKQRRELLALPETVEEATDVVEEYQPQNQQGHPGYVDPSGQREPEEPALGKEKPVVDPLVANIADLFTELKLGEETERILRETVTDKKALFTKLLGIVENRRKNAKKTQQPTEKPTDKKPAKIKQGEPLL